MTRAEFKKLRAASPEDAAAQLPPHSIEAEQGLLGCMLLSPGEVVDALRERRVDAGWFYDLRHATIYTVIAGMVAGNKPVDLVTVVAQLKELNELEAVGGLTYVASLSDTTPSAANWPYWHDLLRAKWQLRKLAATCAELGQRLREPEAKAEELVREASGQLLALAEDVTAQSTRPFKEVLVEVVDAMEKEHYTRGKMNFAPGYIRTGFDYFDKVSGGIAPTDYMVLAGRPGAGKTTFALDMIGWLATQFEWWKETGAKDADGNPIFAGPNKGIPIGVFSLEMTSHSLARRLLFWQAQISAGKFKQGFATKDHFEKLGAAVPRLAGANVWLDDEGAQTIGQIEAKARRLARQQGIKLFVLDYLQLVLPDRRSGRIDRVQELTDISARIVALKKSLRVPWLVLAQMNRNIENAESHRVPVLSDLKDCGAIEQDADQVGFLYFPERSRKEGDKRAQEEELIDSVCGHTEHSERPMRVNAYLAKNRDGATGPCALLFHRNQFRFEDWRQWELKHGGAEPGKGERAS